MIFLQVQSSPILVEDFESEDWQSRWTVISNEKYTGEWAVEKAENAPVEIQDDKGLVMQNIARHHAIATRLPQSLTPQQNKSIVVQYEVKLQHGLECGGAYVKLIGEKDIGQDLKTFGSDSQYVIMFGPDQCGHNSKVHFIFRHQNPITKVYEEKHVINPPPVPADRRSHIYTLVIHPNNSFSVMIDLEDYRVGDLLEDFSPAVNPPATIDDPTDIKPSDWVDEEQISDPTAKKPEDWDESQPEEIPDPEAEKPLDWLENEDEEIPDPNAVIPEDWNVEEDGEWTPPLIPNEKCFEVSGCGKWENPMMPNPLYKGPWSPPLIPNPLYKGPYVPRQIPNPDFYEDLNPWNMKPISVLGIEVWTMTDKIYFDNFHVGYDLEEALEYGRNTWGKKVDFEIKLEKEQERALGATESIIDQLLEYFKDQDAVLYILITVVFGLLTSAIFAYTCLKSPEVQIQHREGGSGAKKRDEASVVSETVSDEGLKKRKTVSGENKSE